MYYSCSEITSSIETSTRNVYFTIITRGICVIVPKVYLQCSTVPHFASYRMQHHIVSHNRWASSRDRLAVGGPSAPNPMQALFLRSTGWGADWPRGTEPPARSHGTPDDRCKQWFPLYLSICARLGSPHLVPGCHSVRPPGTRRSHGSLKVMPNVFVCTISRSLAVSGILIRIIFEKTLYV